MLYNDTDASLAGYAGSSVTKPNHTASDALQRAVRVMATTLGSSLRDAQRGQEHPLLLRLDQRIAQSSNREVARTVSILP